MVLMRMFSASQQAKAAFDGLNGFNFGNRYLVGECSGLALSR